MSDFFISIEGTVAGQNWALGLALLAAVSHAIFGALQKGRFDPWLTRGAIDGAYGLMAVPLVFLVPWPEPHMWPIFAGMMVIHIVYKILQASAYSKGAYTVVYPVVRGTGPLITVIAAGMVFGEHFNPMQWVGVGLLSGGIFGLAAFNLTRSRIAQTDLRMAIFLAFVTGLLVAVYTTYDAFGIRATADPFTFLAWFFLLDGLVFPVIAARRFAKMDSPPPLAPLLRRGLVGGVLAYASFGSIMLATRLDSVGEAAVLRETSTVFAALIGWLFLRETVGPVRAGLMAVIAFGAVVVEFG